MSKQNRNKPRRRGVVHREHWLGAARRILIEGGIGNLSLRKLAEALNMTTGAFYRQFDSIEALHESLRQDWVMRNIEPFTRAIAAAGPDGMRQYLAYVRVLVLEDDFDPRYDNAIRDWAHTSARTAEVLRDIEGLRIEQLRTVFEAMGFTGRSALIRARVTYFHQVGYNAMQITETPEERLSNIPYYAEILTDRPELLALDSADAVRRCLIDGSMPC